ncbi:MAG: Sua5/YciO/YrdC/YwlC family protein, partial [Mariprofundales bacterium]|nr:Sua5/YciO/YrdC/YwlC family protein [Mariprofundales bacterium]
MSGYLRLRLHAERPAARSLSQAVCHLNSGGFVVVQTETTYAMVARPESKAAIAAIRQVRRLDRSHLWALMCADLSQASHFVRMSNSAHRLLRRLLPGPYTFILPATSMIPKRIFGRRQDMGLRIPQLPVCHQLLQQVGSPLLATTMQFADEDQPAYDPDHM